MNVLWRVGNTRNVKRNPSAVSHKYFSLALFKNNVEIDASLNFRKSKGVRYMYQTEVIELTIVGFVMATILIISFFLKGKRRKIGLLLAIATLTAYCTFYVARPFWIDAQINKKVEILRPYLEQRYPDEKWVISTVPHRQIEYKSQNPYYIRVVFQNEPEVTYYYWVKSKINIYTAAYSEESGYSSKLKHFIEMKN